MPITIGDGVNLNEDEKYSIIHHNYDFVEQYINKLNRYTTIQARNLKEKGSKFVWQDLIEKPYKEFVSRFFSGEGYKDGVHGLTLSLLQAFSELTVYSKLWQLQNFDKQDIDKIKLKDLVNTKAMDIKYWLNVMLFKLTGNFVYKIKSKFRL